VPFQMRGGQGGDENFEPKSVTVDGVNVRYAYWYCDGRNYAYGTLKGVGGRIVEAFIPLAWRGGKSYRVALKYTYAGEEGEASGKVRAPKQGGTWEMSNGGNQAFLIREEAGLSRKDEPVELDVHATQDVFTDPARTVRVTLMSEPGVFKRIPSQVYQVDKLPQLEGAGAKGAATVRFRCAFQLSLGAKDKALVHVWDCRRRTSKPKRGIDVKGSAIGGTVENEHYKIKLARKSGQLESWLDKRLGVNFRYIEDRAKPPGPFPISITPDLYRYGVPWSHASDWERARKRERLGPIFYETVRGGPMPGVPEVWGKVAYRFYGTRPEVHTSSLLRVVRNVEVFAFRNGGMLFDKDLFTHVLWPEEDGTTKSLPTSKCIGNDNGAPPQARMPFNTPWVAFYNEPRGLGMALITKNLSYFNEGPYQPNMANAVYYVSLYANRFLYTVRAMNMTYHSDIRTYRSRMRTGTVLYEEMVMLPFKSGGSEEEVTKPIEAARQRLLNPLVVVP